jgi:hypothetical protein
MFSHVSQSGQTLGNISEKHRETSNISEFARKHFCFSGSKFCFRNNVSMGGQTGKHLRKHHESQMFPQQCFLVCPGLYLLVLKTMSYSLAALTRKILFAPLEDKSHVFAPPCIISSIYALADIYAVICGTFSGNCIYTHRTQLAPLFSL